MKILHLTYRDSSGVPSRWADAHREAGYNTSLLVECSHPYRYQGATLVVRWTPGTSSPGERARTLRPFLRGVDAVMAYDHPYYLDAAIATGLPVMFRALGQSARDHADEIRELLASPNVVRASAGLAEISALLDVELVGAPYPLLPLADPDGTRLCHAPADHSAKRTSSVLAAAEATGWQVDLVGGLSNTEALARKRRAAVVVDSGPVGVPDGYGVNSIEAMSMGLPAVSGATRKVRERMRSVGSPVQLVGTQAKLEEKLRQLHDPGLRRDLGEQGRAFVASFHSAEARAAEDMKALERTAVAA